MSRRRNVPSGPNTPRKNTDTTDRPRQKDPVIQRAPEPEVVKAIQEIPETPPAKQVEKAEPVVEQVEQVEEAAPAGKYADLNLKFFTEAWIDEIHKNPTDLLKYYDDLKKAHQAKRSTNLPGDDEAAEKILRKLTELRRIVVSLGYPG